MQHENAVQAGEPPALDLLTTFTFRKEVGLPFCTWLSSNNGQKLHCELPAGTEFSWWIYVDTCKIRG